MKTAITKTKKILAVLMCVFMLSSFAIPLASAEEVENNLEWIFENDAQKTLSVPSTDTPNTVTLPEAKLLSGEGTITYELCADSKGETSFSRIDLAFEDPTKPVVTVKNSVKDYIADAKKASSMTIYAKATAKKDNAEIASKVVALTVVNFKVNVTFLAEKDGDVLGSGEVYYGTSAAEVGAKYEEKAKEFIAAIEPDKYSHNGFNGWKVVEGDDKSTYEAVKGDTTFAPKVESIPHTFDKGTGEINCEAESKIVYHCTGCSYSYTETAPAGHDVDESCEGYEVILAATCTEAGSAKGICKKCGKEATVKLPALGHEIVIDTEEQAVTCLVDGHTEGKHCAREGCDYKVESTIIKHTGHKEKTIEGQKPTCTTNGYTEKIFCEVCGAVKKDSEIIPFTGHDFQYEESKEPTCTEKGHSAGKICKICGETETAIIYPAMGHDMVTDVEEVAATCTEPGRTKGEHCTRCDYKLESEEQAALGHIEVIDKATAATCTEPAKTEGKHCERCGDVLVAQETVGEALGHNMIVYEVAVAATCKEPGKTAGKKCTRCDYKEEPQETALANHEYEIVPGEEDKEPTCTEKGYRAARYCVNCDAELPGEELAANGHVDADGDNQCDVCGAEITYVDPSKDCPHFCHSNNIFKKILWKIVRSFYKLLGIQKVCDCGVLHYN